jgi:hypothetical protein
MADKKKYSKEDLRKWTTESIFDRPFFLTWIGISSYLPRLF